MNYNLTQRRELRYRGVETGVYIVGQNWHLSPWDTMMLLVDLSERGLIEQRPGFLWGKR